MSVVFIDTETSGLPKIWDAPASDLDNWPRLVQIAWIVCDSKLNILDKYHSMVHPRDFEISEDSTRVHGITETRAIRYGKGIHQVLSDFVSVAEKADYLVAHNTDFDLSVILAEIERYNQNERENFEKEKARYEEKHQRTGQDEYDIEEPYLIDANLLGSVEVICTMRSSSEWCKIEGPDGSFKWPTIGELYYKSFKTELPITHDARVDVFAVHKCFKYLISQIEWYERANMSCNIEIAFEEGLVRDEVDHTDRFDYSYRYFLDGLKAEEDQNIDLAYFYYDKAVALDPTNARVQHRLGLCELKFLDECPNFVKFPDYEEHQQYYDSQFEDYSLAMDADGTYFVKRYCKAVDRLRKAVELDPNLFEAKVAFASSTLEMIDEVFTEDRCYDNIFESICSLVIKPLLAAYLAASQASKVVKNDMTVLCLKAALSLRMFQFEAARKLVLKEKLATASRMNLTRKEFETVLGENDDYWVLDEDDGRSNAHFGLAELLMLEGKFPQAALNHLNKGLEFDSSNIKARFVRAKLKEDIWQDVIGVKQDHDGWNGSNYYKRLFGEVSSDYTKTKELQFLNGSINEIPFNHNCNDVLDEINKKEFQSAWDKLILKQEQLLAVEKRSIQQTMDLSVIAKIQLHLFDHAKSIEGVDSFDRDKTLWFQVVQYASVQNALRNDSEMVGVCGIAFDLADKLSYGKGPLFKWRGEALLRLGKFVEGYSDLRKYEDIKFDKWLEKQRS